MYPPKASLSTFIMKIMNENTVKYIVHAIWIAVFASVSIYGIRLFHNLLEKHYYAEAKAAQIDCFHRIDDLQIKRGAPYGGNPGSNCTEITSDFRLF